MSKDMGNSQRGDQTEPVVKCQKCGAMFDFKIHNKDGHISVCPVCGKSVDTEHAKIIDASNEGF